MKKAMDRARAAWGEVPYWVEVLATDCDKGSQRATADKMDVCPAMVSLAINNKWQDLEFIKARVEQVLMVVNVQCPVLGVIDIDRCHAEQVKPPSAANTLRIMLFTACRKCQHNKDNYSQMK